MRLTTVLFIATMMQVSAAGFAQKISMSKSNAPLKSVFKELRIKSGYNFLYTDDLLKKSNLVSINVNNVQFEEVLKEIFNHQPFTYTIENQTVIINEKEQPSFPDRIVSAFDNIDVRGRVVDEKGQPMSGATVKIKDSDQRTRTNENGEFVLAGVHENAMIVISFLGYKLKEVDAKTDLGDVKMESLAGELEEVNVNYNTGYQYVPKERATGSFVYLDNKIINRVPTTDILSRLNSVASGVAFSSAKSTDFNKQLGDASGIRVRGENTIQSDAKPLIILDNFPYDGDLKSINPNDIESVTLLKDAAAASIWGARSGNGVIVLTSKKGSLNQKNNITFSTNLSLSNKPDLFYAPLISSSDYVDFEIELYKQGFYDGLISSVYKPGLTPVIELQLKSKDHLITAIDSTRLISEYKATDYRTDLRDFFYQKQISQQHSLGLSGGTNNNQYYVSIGYDKNRGRSIGNDFSRISVNASNTYSLLNNNLNISTGIWYANSQSTNNGYSPPITYNYADFADESGNALRIDLLRQGYIDTVGSGRLLDWKYYPLKEVANKNNIDKGQNMRLNLDVNYQILPSLKIGLLYLFERASTNTNNLFREDSYDVRSQINLFSSINPTTGAVTRVVPLGGILSLAESEYNKHNFRGQIAYNLYGSEKHDISAIAGFDVSNQNSSGNTYMVYGYNENTGQSTAVDFVNYYKTYISGDFNNIVNNQFFSGGTDRYISFFTNAAYTYNKKYTISGSIRKDGSNLFGVETNNKWNPLWSTGASWAISKEDFYHFQAIPYLKLRSSYGYQGNINKSIAALLTISALGNNKWRLPQQLINNIPNDQLRWETSGKLNLALDFASKNNRLSGIFEFYLMRGIDLIGASQLPPSSGQQAPFKTNSANMKGRGIDLTINSINIPGKFSWSTNANFSYNKNWITGYGLKLTNIKSYISGGSGNPVIGNPSSAIYSYKWAGLNPLNGNPQGFIAGAVSSDYSNLLNSANLEDMELSGQQLPKYFGNLINTIAYNTFQLSFNISFKAGHVFRRPAINYSNLSANGISVGSNEYNRRWQKAGDEQATNVPSYAYPFDFNRDQFYQYASINILKADHIRLEDVRLSYGFNPAKKVFKSFEVYLVASNLGIIWRANKEGIDPENIPYGPDIYNPKFTLSTGIKFEF